MAIPQRAGRRIYTGAFGENAWKKSYAARQPLRRSRLYFGVGSHFRQQPARRGSMRRFRFAAEVATTSVNFSAFHLKDCRLRPCHNSTRYNARQNTVTFEHIARLIERGRAKAAAYPYRKPSSEKPPRLQKCFYYTAANRASAAKTFRQTGPAPQKQSCPAIRQIRIKQSGLIPKIRVIRVQTKNKSEKTCKTFEKRGLWHESC